MPIRRLFTRALFTAVLIVLSPLILCTAIVAVGWLMHFLCTAYLPTAYLMQQKLYWYTWHDIKRLGHKRTKVVLRALFCLSEHEVIECRLRDPMSIKRLRKHYMLAILGENEMLGDTPGRVELVPFYEFRFRRRIVLPRRARFAWGWQQPAAIPA